MGTHLHLSCDGCAAEVRTERIARAFHGFSGRSHGFGVHHEPSIEEAVQPTNWVWSDPYTGCTYCPKCWKEIEDGVDKEREYREREMEQLDRDGQL